MNRLLSIAAALTLTAGAVSAQGFAAPVSTGSTIFRLGSDSNFSEGCLDPCKCPIFLGGEVRGTMILRPVFLGGTFEQYEVSQINWTQDLNGVETKIKGDKGIYTRISGFAGWTNQLELFLSIDGGPVAKFDSGSVAGGGDFPNIDLTIADNDFYCYNQIIRVAANPAPKKDVTRYNLRSSSYQEGCFPPCLCPLGAPSKLVGSFDLVLLKHLGTVSEYSITNIRWQIANPILSTSAKQSLLTGTGDYTLIQGFAGPIHEMDLCLDLNGVELDAFHSGLVNTLPTKGIQIQLTQNDFFCFDRVINLKANPAPVALPLASSF